MGRGGKGGIDRASGSSSSSGGRGGGVGGGVHNSTCRPL